MDRIQDVYALEEQIYELVDGYLQEADCYATAPVLAVWKRCGKLNVAVDVETNLKLTKTADVIPNCGCDSPNRGRHRPRTRQRQNRRDCLCVV